LEQRIGRLDRIGQQQDVHIHVPYADGTPTATKFHWYHQILHCVEQQNPAASAIHDEYWSQLTEEDLVSLSHDVEDTPRLQEARAKLEKLQQEIQEGRDALLEMNSCRQPFANDLVERIAEFEKSTPHDLVETASDLFQFYFEEIHTGVYSLIPSDKMLIAALPGIPPEGSEVTFSRDVANAREDVLFLTWDSPFILGLWELLHHSELGSASVATLPSPKLPAGHCLLELCFDIVIQSPYSAQCLPFMAEHSVRSLVLDVSDNDLADALDEVSLGESLVTVNKGIARKIIQTQKDNIPAWFEKADRFAEGKKQHVIDEALQNVQRFFDNEISRLKNLQTKNPNVSEEDVAVLQDKKQKLLSALDQNAQLQLSAVRLIVITD
jgi:ATP-dependent helicase HepA